MGHGERICAQSMLKQLTGQRNKRPATHLGPDSQMAIGFIPSLQWSSYANNIRVCIKWLFLIAYQCLKPGLICAHF